jgi:hypothetical protein
VTRLYICGCRKIRCFAQGIFLDGSGHQGKVPGYGQVSREYECREGALRIHTTLTFGEEKAANFQAAAGGVKCVKGAFWL